MKLFTDEGIYTEEAHTFREACEKALCPIIDEYLLKGCSIVEMEYIIRHSYEFYLCAEKQKRNYKKRMGMEK